ncbi:Uncharacterised protein [uncultured archaeon]|nr:Uncharacterised protein [uncultured archaeon]
MKKTSQEFAIERVKTLLTLVEKTKEDDSRKYYLQLARLICSKHKLNTHELGLSKKQNELVDKKIRIIKGKRMVAWITKK